MAQNGNDKQVNNETYTQRRRDAALIVDMLQLMCLVACWLFTTRSQNQYNLMQTFKTYKI